MYYCSSSVVAEQLLQNVFTTKSCTDYSDPFRLLSSKLIELEHYSSASYQPRQLIKCLLVAPGLNMCLSENCWPVRTDFHL